MKRIYITGPASKPYVAAIVGSLILRKQSSKVILGIGTDTLDGRWDALVVLPGWGRYASSCEDVRVAKERGARVFYYPTEMQEFFEWIMTFVYGNTQT